MDNLTTSQQGVYDRVVHGSLIGLAEKVVLPAHDGRPLSPLHRVVVKPVSAVIGISPDPRPQLIGIVQRLSQQVVRRTPVLHAFHPRLHGIQDGKRLPTPLRTDFLLGSPAAPEFFFQCIEYGDVFQCLCRLSGVALLRLDELSPDVRHAGQEHDAGDRFKVIVHLVAVRLHRPPEMPQLRPWDFTGTAAFQVVEVSAAALRTCVPELPGVAVPATLSGAVGMCQGTSSTCR